MALSLQQCERHGGLGEGVIQRFVLIGGVDRVVTQVARIGGMGVQLAGHLALLAHSSEHVAHAPLDLRSALQVKVAR
jgi:hypothetical protein